MGSKDTIVPRFGLDTVQTVTYKLDTERRDLTIRQVGILEDKINNKFEEPSELGDIEHSFRSEVSYDKLFNIVKVKTTTSNLKGSEIDEISEIIELTLGSYVDDYNIESSIGRKSMDADFL